MIGTPEINKGRAKSYERLAENLAEPSFTSEPDLFLSSAGQIVCPLVPEKIAE
jgi:hypothetical protein